MTVFLSPARLARLRERIAARREPTWSAYGQMLAEADAQLARAPHVPETWYIPGYYTDPQGHIQSKEALAGDANAAYTLALAYQLSSGEHYARAAARLAAAWSVGPKKLRHENDSTLSFSYHFPALIFAEDLLRGSPAWDGAQAAAFRAFIIERALTLNCMERENNWGNWGLVLVLAVAASAGLPQLFAQGAARWKEFIERQIAPDGHLPLEVGRNHGRGEHGLWYTHFSLMPQTLAAEILLVNGVDVYDYVSPRAGVGLRAAYERAAPWARDPATFPYFKGSDVREQSGTDYVSYYEILHPRWPNPDAAAMLSALRPLTATHCAPWLTLTHGE
jgi:hypothetical protein